tara:strand:- start:749 stop:2113 length:1365 start_codon:yes stop_codon:yes gene_type:complete
MASTYLRHTEGTSATDGKKFTFSTWLKRSKLGTDQTIFYNYINGSNFAQIYFRGSQKDIRYFDRVSGGDTCVGTTAPVFFNDINGWYNIVLKVDTTQSASANKVQFYINGEYLAFNFDNVPNTNQVLTLGSAGTRTIGSDNSGNSNNFDGLMSYVALIDGTAESANIFGETDTTTGQWKIKTTITPSVAWGNTGFWILKDGNSVTDQSGNGNNFTAGGNLTKTEDCPSNVMATFNPLYPHNSTFTYGNTKCMSGSSGEFGSVTTLPMTGTGKYYAEFKWTNGSYPILGVCDDIGLGLKTNVNMTFGKTGTTGSIGFKSNGSWRVNNSDTSIAGSFALNDIIGSAIDKSTNKIYFSKNGVWSNGSGGWGSSTFNAAVGAIDVSSILTGDMWFWGVGTDTGTANQIWEMNAGNGYYGITAVTTNSGNGYAGAEGASKFSYQPPTNYHALNTKGMNQ